MSWLERYKKGSYRGVGFFTESSTTTVGRRAAIYALPFDDSGVAHVDLGRAPRKFRIRALLLGDDYDRERDKFVKELEKPGAGLLVHPYFGRHMVMIGDDISITESTENGGCCEIDFNAVEARDELPADGGLSLLDSARNLRDAASDNLLAKLLVEGPDFLTQDVFDALDAATRELTILNAQIGAWLAAPGNLAAKIDRLSKQAANLLDTPRKLFDAFDGFFQSLAASVSRVVDASAQEDLGPTVRQAALKRSVLKLGALGAEMLPIPSANTAARRQQRANRAALLFGLRASALANFAAAFAETVPESRSDALDLANAIADQLTRLAEDAIEGEEISAEMYDAAHDLGAQSVALADSAGDEGGVATIKVSATTSVLVLAYKLYGDASRADEILARNPQILHPGAIPPNLEIEVLAR